MPKKPWGGFRKIGGSHIGQKAVKVYECNGCRAQYRGSKPSQCRDCGRMDFNKIDSTTEAHRLGVLRLLEGAGKIKDLETQVRFPLMAFRDGRAVVVGHYVADAVYFDVEKNVQVIEDTKSDKVMSDLASWKLRHMTAQGTPVTIVTPKG